MIVEGERASVLVDQMHLRRCVMNLLSNAVKFTHDGEIAVRTALEQRGESYWLSISVDDTGVGIPPAALERLFQPFAQCDASISRKYGGTGLGLFITKQLVELMGGAIDVESEQGRGSCFRIVLPVALAQEGLAHATPESRAA